jgi:hypothetical protein
MSHQIEIRLFNYILPKVRGLPLFFPTPEKIRTKIINMLTNSPLLNERDRLADLLLHLLADEEIVAELFNSILLMKESVSYSQLLLLVTRDASWTGKFTSAFLMRRGRLVGRLQVRIEDEIVIDLKNFYLLHDSIGLSLYFERHVPYFVQLRLTYQYA